MFHVEKVALNISCRNLQSSNLASQSDIQVRLFIQNRSKTETLSEETEKITNNSNPNFKNPLIIEFFFEINQNIKFNVLNNGQILETIETTSGAIMGAKQKTLIIDLREQTGQIIIRAEKVKTESKVVSWQWSGKTLVKSGCFGRGTKKNPYLNFFQKMTDGELLYTAATELIFKSQNPVWKPFKILDKNLCSEYNQDFKVECWDGNLNGKDKIIGEFETSLEKIKSGVKEYDLRKKKSKTGKFSVSNFSIDPHITFLDYLFGETKLNVIVGMDLSASNGQQQNLNSLHHQSVDPPNPYYQALSSLLPLVLNYDSHPLIYGFGAENECQVPRGVNDCFPMETAGKDTESILKAYYKTLDEMILSGPTKLVPLIKHISDKCREIKETEKDEYVVLLIFTNGEITDTSEARREILKASDLPLSIRLIGIGDGDFPELHRLNRVRTAETRELVQFVPFWKYKNDLDMFSQMTLYDVPDELVKYMELIGRNALHLNSAAAAVGDKSQLIDYE